MAEDALKSPARPRLVAAFAVHVFTACGAACALLALIAAAHAAWTQVFAWLAVALAIDGMDGIFARRLRVAELLPRWSGDLLDFVIDFATYVLVPAYAMAVGGLLPAPAALPLGIIVAITGALYFADRTMKTTDGYFRGFPVLWNVAAFYLFLLKPPPWLGAAAIVVLAAATFAPIHFVHPLRAKQGRTLNVVALSAGIGLGVFALTENLDPPFWVTAALCAVAVYFVSVGLIHGADRSLAPP